VTTDGERLAAVEQRLTDMRREFDVHLDDAQRRHNRIRELENAMLLLVEAQKNARAAENKQYRRLVLAIQVAGVLVALGMFALAVTVAVTHHG
jgi:hypothetical protein